MSDFIVGTVIADGLAPLRARHLQALWWPMLVPVYTEDQHMKG